MILEKVYDELLGMIEDLKKQIQNGGGGSDVSITPTLESGVKIADYEIDGDAGVLYVPENLHTYSTDEQIVGTWIDGEDLYEKTIFVEPEYSGSGDDKTASISLPAGIIVHDLRGGVCDADGKNLISFGYTNVSPAEYVRGYVASGSLSVTNNFYSSRPYVLAIISYTKETEAVSKNKKKK